jgi:SAM-dependent methyltransferase
MSLPRFYDWLSWFQDVAGHVGHDTGRRELAVHRRLQSDSGPPSGTVVHDRLLDVLTDAAPLPREPRVLDAGCGLGGTTFFLQRALGGRYSGITLSDAQRDRATREAARRGLDSACTFVVRNYDDDLRDLLPDGVDLIVAIESLAHSPSPAATVARLARWLRPEGRLAIVDDMPSPRLPPDDRDFDGFRRGWLCPALAPAASLAAAMDAAGLTLVADVDLTPAVPLRAPRSLAWLVRLNAAARPLARPTPVRVLVESLHGGLMLERLYRRGLMEYRLLVARRPAAS